MIKSFLSDDSIVNLNAPCFTDDGAISWEEFVQFFADGVMGKEEMEKLFNDIDTHNTK